MPDESTLDREQQALSFNPFGDNLEDNSGNDRELRTAGKPTMHLLDISSLSISDGRSSSNASSAVSAHTNPLFDALDAPSQADSAASRPLPASSGSFLNPTADSYTPPGSIPLARNHPGGVAPSSSSSISNGKVSSPGNISVAMGVGGGPPRRHRLSSASSVISTRSRRSTSSSLSSLNIRNPSSLPGQAAEGDTVPAALPELSELNHSSSPLPPLAAPLFIKDRSHSQESVISLQPSVLSLETTAKSPPPVAGYRVPATGSLQHSSFPQLSMCGPAFKDFDDHPIYVCSAILGTAIHPAKAGPHLLPPVRMSFAGKEILHEGRFDLLPITPE